MRVNIPGLLLLFIMTAPFISYAQKTIHGRVTDSQSGKGIPSAHVSLVGQRAGTITNNEGKYQLEILTVPMKVRFSSIGYHSLEMQITVNSPDSLDVALDENPVALDEIVVTDEDPAVDIMREVIRRKQIWQRELKSYSAEGYAKIVISNDSTIVSVEESNFMMAWERKNGVTRATDMKRQTKNLSDIQNMADLSGYINYYSDYYDAGESRIIGVTHPDALKSYRFKLIGQRKLDSRTVYDISVAPKNDLENLCAGEISVLDEEFALIRAKMKIVKPFPIPPTRNELISWNESLFPPPRKEETVYSEQEFSNFGKTFWLPVKIVMDRECRIGILGGSMPVIHESQLNLFSNYRVNERTDAAPDTLAGADSTRVGLHHRIPLTEQEQQAYSAIDSTLTYAKAFKGTGLIGGMIRTERVFPPESAEAAPPPGQSDDSPQKKPSPRTNRLSIMKSLYPRSSFNRVDGPAFGLGLKKIFRNRLSFDILPMYRKGTKRWTYDTRFSYSWGSRSNGSFDLRLQDGTVPWCESQVYRELTNTILTVFGQDDYFDYYWNIKQSLGAGYRFPGAKIDVGVAINREKHASLKKTTDQSLFGEKTRRENPPVEAGRLGSLELTLAYGDAAFPFVIGNRRRFEVTFEYGDPGIFNGDFAFRKYQLAADWRFNTLFRRSAAPNTLDLRLIGMTSDGNLPIQRRGAIDSGFSRLCPYGSFRSLSGGPRVGEQLCALFWEHNFRCVPFDMAHLHRLSRRGTEIILQGASGRTWISGNHLNRQTVKPAYLDRFHHEIGLSVNNIFTGLRADVTKNLGTDAITWGVGYKRPF